MSIKKAFKQFKENHPDVKDDQIYIILGNALQCRHKPLQELCDQIKEMEELLDIPKKYKINRHYALPRLQETLAAQQEVVDL